MPAPLHNEEQAFLDGLDKKLWNAADRLRHSLDAAVYKHAVLGLIFLKYVSDSFGQRQAEIEAQLRDPEHDYYLDPVDYGGRENQAYAEAIRTELEERDYYIEKNVFWVPALARWKTIQDSAALPPGTEIPVSNGKKSTYTMKSLGRFIDDVLEEVEKENPKLKGVIEKNRYARLELPPESLRGLINLFSDTDFTRPTHNGKAIGLHAKDILGHVYEYFLGQFALAEGKKGGQYFTPKSIVSLIVEMLEPYKGRVYDPAMGSGGFFVQSEKFIKEHGGKLGNLSVYGQESNPTTWRLAAISGKPESELDNLPEPQHQSLAQTAALFPSAFIDSELGDIPEGWQASTIGEETKTVGGATPSTKVRGNWKGGTYHWVTPKDFSSLQDKVLLGSSRKITDEGLSKISSGLFTNRNCLDVI